MAVGTPPDHEKCQSAWLVLVCLSNRYESIVEGMERRQMAKRQRRAFFISSVPSFTSTGGMSGMDGTGGSSFLKAVIERLKERLDAGVGGL